MQHFLAFILISSFRKKILNITFYFTDDVARTSTQRHSDNLPVGVWSQYAVDGDLNNCSRTADEHFGRSYGAWWRIEKHDDQTYMSDLTFITEDDKLRVYYFIIIFCS